jgi:hypothetical protein
MPSRRLSPTGPIHAKDVDTEGAHKDVIKFPNSSVTIRHHTTGHHQTHDKKTCYFTFAEHGTYKVVKGTGAYAGVSGHGFKYRAMAQAVQCKQNKEPKVFHVSDQSGGTAEPVGGCTPRTSHAEPVAVRDSAFGRLPTSRGSRARCVRS